MRSDSVVAIGLEKYGSTTLDQAEFVSKLCIRNAARPIIIDCRSRSFSLLNSCFLMIMMPCYVGDIDETVQLSRRFRQKHADLRTRVFTAYAPGHAKWGAGVFNWAWLL
jgi:hypothetical protein